MNQHVTELRQPVLFYVPSDETKKKCTSWKNQERATLPPKEKHLIQALAKINGQSRSSVIKNIVREHFNKMGEGERHRIISLSKNHY